MYSVIFKDQSVQDASSVVFHVQGSTKIELLFIIIPEESWLRLMRLRQGWNQANPRPPWELHGNCLYSSLSIPSPKTALNCSRLFTVAIFPWGRWD